MITLETRLHVTGLTGRAITDFLLDCTDDRYRAWWPGTHLALHPLERHGDHRGDVVVMDEYIGQRRVRLTGVVVEATPGARIVWRLRHWSHVPVSLRLDLTDTAAGVAIRHTIEAGFDGLGRVIDPVMRLVFSAAFGRAMDEHVRVEFPRLRDYLAVQRSIDPATPRARASSAGFDGDARPAA